MRRVRLGFLIGFFAATSLAHAQAGDEVVKTDSKVKATATATKPDTDGKQIVNIAIVIDKEYRIAANPVNHNHGFLDDCKLMVKVTAGEKVTAEIKYPPGKTRRDGDEHYDTYVGEVKIRAEVVRTKGDVSPLQISVRVQGWADFI